jgi:hypothetical protein
MRNESRGELTASSRGTLVTSAGTVNTKGSWVDLGSATGFAYEAITVWCYRGDIAANYMVDIGISDGSNRFVLVADLYLAGQKLAIEYGFHVTLPLRVPAGAQLSARVACSVVSRTLDVGIVGHSSGIGGAPGFSRCVALFTPASSRGIAVDPGGTANTKGAWAELTSSSPARVGAMFGLIGFNNDVARTATGSLLLDIGVGVASSEFVLYPNANVSWGATRDGPSNCPRVPPFACDVPAGTRIAARAQGSVTAAGDRAVDLALYGLVP